MDKKATLIFLLAIVLSSCTGEMCIDADDFGHSTVTVPARYTREELNNQKGENQIGPWINSEHRVNGRPLAMTVKGWENGLDFNYFSELSAWCAWYGTSKDKGKLADICVRMPECRFINDNMCTNTADAQLLNPPCIFKNGVALYALIAEKYTDPNQSLDSQADPRGINFHLGEAPSGYKQYEVDKRGNTREVGGRVFQYESNQQKVDYSNAELYFKILDKFYDANSGQYKVVIKSGVTRSNPDPISYVTKLVKEFLFGTEGKDDGLIRKIYLGIVNNPGYRLAVSALLTLYIMYTGLSYLAGNIQLTQIELITRVIKIAIISALLNTEYSWSFFNDYLFVYFIGGVEQILQMIIEAGATGPGSPGILALMMAPQTVAKLLSLLFTDWLGLIYIILFFVALYFILIIFFKATVIYLSALIAIGMIIIMGPVFICFLLFDVTRSLFDNWLKQLISYALQPIILFTGLIFISMILRQEIYGALGFRVCKQGFPVMTNSDGAPLFGDKTADVLGPDLSNSIFYWWFPQPMKAEQFSKETKAIPIPIDHFADENVIGTVSSSGFCEAYACVGDRYVDLPFLDPTKDARRITQFWNGKFVQLDGLLLIFVAIYLLNKFNSLAVSISRFITDTSGNLTKLGKTEESVSRSSPVIARKSGALIASMSGRAKNIARKGIKGLVDKSMGQEKRQALTSRVRGFSPSGIANKLRMSKLKKEALSSGANKSVLDEVRKNSGLNQANLKKDAIKNYKSALRSQLLKNLDPSLPKAKREKIAKETASKLSKQKFSNLKEKIAQIKFGKKHQQLSQVEQEQIAKTLNDPQLKSLAKDSSAARRFGKAYAETYMSMADKKESGPDREDKTLRSVAEINNDTKQGKEPLSEHKELSNKPENNQSYQAIGRANRIDVDKTIDSYNSKYETNVTSPEFLAQAKATNNPDLEIFKELEKQQIESTVRSELAKLEDPSLLDNTEMSDEPEKDTQTKQTIDKLYEIKKNLIENDQFISREEEYQLQMEIAAENIKEEESSLKTEEVKNNISEFNDSQQVLEQIDDRKEILSSEIDKHVEKINEHRKKANMSEYKTEKENFTSRKTRTIEDYSRNK
jgi:type IV secretion system protein VirB6